MFLVPMTLWAVLAAGAEPDDAAALVARLGSPRYLEREQAARDLEARGQEALAVLRQARQARDPEVRSRVSVLIERIENGVLVKPTLVKLDYRDRPLAEVVQDLAAQSKFPLSLGNPTPPNANSSAPRITLREPNPVPFWKAMELLGKAARVQPSISMTMGLPRGGPTTAITLVPGETVAPTSHSGPFRISLTAINHDRHRTFHGGMAMPGFGNANFPPLPVAPFAGEAAQGQVTDNFYFTLQVIAEPRMTLSQQGGVRLTEAIDDRGNFLLPAGASAAQARNSGFNGYVTGSTPQLTPVVQLSYPEQPGRTIKRLRGVVPLIVSARKDDPTMITLADAKGKSFQAAEATLTIHEVKADPNNPRQTTIDLSFRVLPAGHQANAGMGRMMLQDMGMRAMHSPQSQIEILDADGKPYTQWFPASQQFNGEESRMTLAVLSQPGLGPPARIRYYDLMRAETEATFEFQDVPMP